MTKSATPPTLQQQQEELDELGEFLLSDATSNETMMLDTLDGYLTAILLGPSLIKTSEWLPGVWGATAKDEPVFETMEQAQRILSLIMRQMNHIAANLQDAPDQFEPIFDDVVYEGDPQEYLDGEMWAYGFMRGIQLRRSEWQVFFDTPAAVEALRPIYLLGAEEVSDEDEALVATPAQRAELAGQIPASVAWIYRYWLPHRKAVFEQAMPATFQREQPKTGRNDPCPCGSGQKFKKCCGNAPTLH
ncbi:MAG: UPF0149 family protein [Gallionella sp.]|nr:UPF0149 family protein [Gallionella sp.]